MKQTQTHSPIPMAFIRSITHLPISELVERRRLTHFAEQLIHTILDFPFPTIALITGHTFGGACPLALAHDYRIMNSRRGFISMPPVNLGLHFDGIGALPRLKLRPQIARKMLLEAHKWTGKQALEDGIVDAVAEPEQMLDAALELAAKWAPKAKMG